MKNENEQTDEINTDALWALKEIFLQKCLTWKVATEPFLVEPFCAQVAWMGGACPVYPLNAQKPNEVCRFLTSPEYKNYECPACNDENLIFGPIFERGTPEQKKSLENLADMTVRYSQNPIEDPRAISWLKNSGYRSLSNALKIYEKLGLNEKAKVAKDILERLLNPVVSESQIKIKS